ncbi:Transcriptional regulator, TetR family [Labilithrix luteola]|uniref:Transcriptional regulator, TetR family n=1 Tax=Labilithrix luteola TaxID=1391654 RepID=A0A0K1PKY3_9BACT|nr:Transcriptional regulator, TetR family [Labilithrix luteola]
MSFRKVGAALDAGPMRLYGYVSTKEELLELMVDAVYGEMPLSEVKGEWRQALRALAHGMRRMSMKHPWFPELLGSRPHIGPNALAHLEATLAAFSETLGFENIDDVMLAVTTVKAYVMGAIQSEVTELRIERETGMDKERWQSANGAYILRMIATGRYPTLGKVVEKATHPSPDVRFDMGLDYVLDGIAARHLR